MYLARRLAHVRLTLASSSKILSGYDSSVYWPGIHCVKHVMVTTLTGERLLSESKVHNHDTNYSSARSWRD